MLPWLGSRTSLVALGASSFAGGLLLLAVSELRRPVRLAVGALATIVFAGSVWAGGDPFDEFLKQRYPGQRLIWREEGVEATSAVVVSGSGEISLTVNGTQLQAGDGVAGVSAGRMAGEAATAAGEGSSVRLRVAEQSPVRFSSFVARRAATSLAIVTSRPQFEPATHPWPCR